MTPIAESAAISDRIRIRPSVSWVERQNGVVEFFLGNTRRQKEVRAVPPLLAALRQMNGQQNLGKRHPSTVWTGQGRTLTNHAHLTAQDQAPLDEPDRGHA